MRTMIWSLTTSAFSLVLTACNANQTVQNDTKPSIYNNYGEPSPAYEESRKIYTDVGCALYKNLDDYAKAPLGCQRRLQSDRYTKEISDYCKRYYKSGNSLRFGLENNWKYFILIDNRSIFDLKPLEKCAEKFSKIKNIDKNSQIYSYANTGMQ